MRFKWLLLILSFLIFITCFDLFSQEIKSINISTNSNILIVNSSLDKNISNEIIDLLKNGVKITIVYNIKVVEKKPFWMIFDEVIYEKDVKKSVNLNIWEKKFYLNDNGKNIELDNIKDLQNLLKKIVDIKTISVKNLKDKNDIYIKVKAQLESIKLFPPLSWIYDIVLTRSFETSWKEKKIK